MELWYYFLESFVTDDLLIFIVRIYCLKKNLSVAQFIKNSLFTFQVLSLFLDTLVDLIAVHARDLTDQLYVLMTRLINKTGADMLGSVQSKVQRALDAVRYVYSLYQELKCKVQNCIMHKVMMYDLQSTVFFTKSVKNRI